jgi:hypothetical protein
VRHRTLKNPSAAALSIFTSFLIFGILSALFASAGLIAFLCMCTLLCSVAYAHIRSASLLAITLAFTLVCSTFLTTAILGTYILVRTLRTMSSSSNNQGLLSTLSSAAADALNVSGSGSSPAPDSSKPSHKQSNSMLVKKPDGTLDGPATVAKHRELNAAHMDSLDASNDLAQKPVVDSGADSAPDVTKPNGA